MSSNPKSSSGKTCPAHEAHQPIATWNPARDVWEKPHPNLLCEHSDAYSETWPAAGTMRNGQAYEHQTSAPVTDANAYFSTHTAPKLPTPRTTHACATETRNLLPTPATVTYNDTETPAHWHHRTQKHETSIGKPLPIAIKENPNNFGKYKPAIKQHEHLTQRPAPQPLENHGTKQRLTIAFLEWMMGLPENYLTHVPKLTRTQAITLTGNGVIPAQAKHALTQLTTRTTS